MRYFPIVFIVFFILFLIEVITTIKKRSEAGEMLIYATYESRASEPFNLIGGFIIVLLYLWILYKQLKRVVPLLYPQYLDKWYQIFNRELLERIREGFVEKGMLYESQIIAQFSGFMYLMLFISWIIITFIYAYDYFGKKGICDKAIFLGRSSLYSWNKISCYEWGEHYYKGNKGLKKLHISIKNGKVSRMLTGKDEMKVNLAVRIEDYEKADSILQERITKCEEAVNDKAGAI
ncbi:hypothetical protein [Lutispora thermophila]|uniref:DUF5673 domain-containing protein n=1 Tax=Lutispora thermophila DSM 19022 TaxID=1122184 RepID=A0A1M6B4Z8_9FIRM|nr:hypothetical protein [Lutispora thermophila]SHI43822.1 hypothetical protein SAMN02745176_00276 [Lutispora thermophila DSM 19022]